MAAPGFRLNYKGMGEYLRGDEMLKMVAEKGQAAKVVAEATAPDYAPIGEGYVNAFVLEVGLRKGKHPRACATLKNTSRHAIFVEFGGKATARHRTLGKAIGAVD